MAENKDKKVLNVPNLRFPEFQGEWVVSRLSEYLNENKERNKKGLFNKTDVLSVSGDFGIVNQIDLLGRSFAGASVLPYHVVRLGNIVYTKSPLKEYPYGIVKANTGKVGIVSTLYAVYSVNDNANDKFIEYYFSLANRANRYFKPIVRIGAKHDMKIGNQEVLANQVVFPTVKEQEKIADFLSLIDERISTQNKIIEDLKKLKSAIIEMEYSHNTKSNLHIGDFIEQTSKRNKDGAIQNVLSVSNSQGFIQQSEQFENRSVASDDTSNYKIVERNSFAFNPARINVGSIARLATFDRGIVSPMYICFRTRDNLFPEYLDYYFESKQFSTEIQKRLEGSVRQCLSFEGLCNIPLSIPTIEVQQQTGKRLSTLAQEIKLEIDFLELLQKQKKFLLYQMFI
ncbi:restriction endonuclease subunit S [Prevotella intermedia]|uniref:restriction endonuclease subunit S n=1 Tax=Prevotella intermedia TaxID=28131 RepID=UPI0021512467|nr:restriction endonuclease subunit S [Prevotella intermedia]